MGQRNLTTKVVGGVTFDPVYSVNDWGYVGFFVGHNYQCSASGTHSISDQKDFRVEKPFKCRALFPDGTVETVEVVQTDLVRTTVGDMGHDYPVTYPTFGIKKNVHGVDVVIDVTQVYIDLVSITEV